MRSKNAHGRRRVQGDARLSLCLSRTEIHELTRKHTRKGQRAFLVQNGIRHYLDDHGWPVVLRSAVEPVATPAQDGATWKPNKAA